ncbi:MAG: AraC family transcriptional regulator [Romboutsia sp.]|uniref:AraC family transcriptional regulator n=1 Tax=Romboutsia sp. TaxID=1965302 RepID=UPI003F3A96A3
MKLKQIKVNLWHKYILYYCIIFIIPFILLVFFVSKFTIGKVEEQFDTNIISNLNKSQETLYSQIDELGSIAIQISKDPYLSPGRMKHDYYSSLGEEMISRYVSSKKIIDDIVLYYFENDNKFYSSNGLYGGKDLLIRKYYKDTNISKIDLNKILNLKTSQLISLPNIDKDNNIKFNIYYVFPLYDYSNKQCGTVTYMLDEEQLIEILPGIDKNNNSEVYITDKNNNVILSNVKGLNKDFIDNKGSILDILFKDENYSTDKTKYRSKSTYLGELDLKFINIVDNKDLTVSLVGVRIKVFTFLGILLCIGLILILAISYYQYIPIRRINTTLNKKMNNKDNNIRTNELTSIELLVKNILHQNEELINKSNFLREIDKNQVLLNLIEGININKSNENSTFIYELEEYGKCYYIVLIKKSQLVKENKSEIYKRMSLDNDIYKVFTIQIPLQDKIGLLVIHKQPNIDVKDSLKFIQSNLNNFKDDVYFYCGGLYDEVSKINQSYIEAMIACDYMVDNIENKHVLYRETYNYDKSSIKYPYDVEEKLVYAIKQGSKEVVDDSLKQIFKFINCNKYYSEQIKIYSLYLVSLIIKTASQVDFPHEGINMKDLVEYNNIRRFEENISNLVNDINEFVSSKREKVKDKFRENIFNDINESYKSHDLSLELLSQKYDYSVPYLSKIIKEETGMTFTKYIQELRFDYIKESLIKTDLPIKEIVFGAGYYDMSNFSRKFKTVMGVTPSQYREINKSSKSLEII